MKELTIIIVWHNEEKNLQKLFKSLKNFENKVKLNVYYCDQESDDDSVKIAKDNWAIIEHHPKYWICESSRIRATDEHVENGEWILYLDADEEISSKLADEMVKTIESDLYEVCIVPINVYFMKMRSQTFHQPRMFKKWAIKLKDVAHHWWDEIISDKRIHLKNKMMNIDFKNVWCEIYNHLEKMNRYTENEVAVMESISKTMIFYGMFIKPIIWFFWFWIWWWFFFKWMAWWILAYYNATYQFFKYAKAYEKFYIK